ncbi:4-(cytidine 5'-diphospho)-2-C-methyl-D-erythritol kinase [Tropheryma whipplei]|nr:4-diphosphocytidyl-2C-methyl-D-erythritol kinase [Tropheryma whipplei]AAO44702.1 4-diphosphocytidyl-2-C-methyl-D-erythritol kinase [Tropheryma whipplei str. Twist]
MMIKKITRVSVPGKINPILLVGPKRPDGYHGLFTVYLGISLYEHINITLDDSYNRSREMKTDGGNTWRASHSKPLNTANTMGEPFSHSEYSVHADQSEFYLNELTEHSGQDNPCMNTSRLNTNRYGHPVVHPCPKIHCICTQSNIAAIGSDCTGCVDIAQACKMLRGGLGCTQDPCVKNPHTQCFTDVSNHAMRNVLPLNVSNTEQFPIQIEYANGRNPVLNPMDDLAMRAALLLSKDIDLQNTHILPSTRISIEKNIPVAAGLAGGSADAAAVLLGINSAWQTNYSRCDLLGKAGALGADVPFLIWGGAAYGSGTGSCVTFFETQTLYWVLCFSKHPLSTRKVFQELDRQRSGAGCNHHPVFSNPAECAEMLKKAIKRGPEALAALLHNDLTSAAKMLMPEIAERIKAAERCPGILRAIISGSGPTLALLAEDAEAANRACSILKDTGVICKAVSSPAYSSIYWQT